MTVETPQLRGVARRSWPVTSASMTSRVPAQRAAASVERVLTDVTNADTMLESLDDELRRFVRYDGATWFGVDPATLLATAPSRIDGIEAGHCDTFWHREFLVADTNLFHDLSRRPVPVAGLRMATDNRPVRSARYREFLAPQGYADELRAVFRVGDNVWGIVGLYRSDGRPAFDQDDVAMLHAMSGAIADAMRRHVAGSTPWQAAPAAPGLMVFDAACALVSANDEAGVWLDEIDVSGTSLLSSDSGDLRQWLDARPGARGADVGFPPAVIALVAKARAVADGHERGPARLRLRGRNGRWLVLHASCLSAGRAADSGMVAVVVEPAKSGEIAPVIVEAYALSPRERDVVRGLARGMSTAEIAGELYLSAHTVRDYVKSVFEKVGVSSRGELVAKLFAEHYTEPLHVAAVHAS
jgi:DNA-binding CsgD family transcriptional regulator